MNCLVHDCENSVWIWGYLGCLAYWTKTEWSWARFALAAKEAHSLQLNPPLHLSNGVRLTIPLAFSEHGLISPVLNAASIITVWVWANLATGMCDGFVTNLALWEKGFTLLPEESVILLDGTPLSWSGRVLITTLVPLMSAATQSGIGRSKASAFSGSGFFCLEKDRLEIFLGCTCGLLFSTWGLLFLFTGLCAGRSKGFAFPENGLTFWLTELVMLLDSSSLWGGGQFFFISAWTKRPPRTRVCWHFASRQSWVKGKERKWSVKFYLNHFFRLVKRK